MLLRLNCLAIWLAALFNCLIHSQSCELKSGPSTASVGLSENNRHVSVCSLRGQHLSASVRYSPGITFASELSPGFVVYAFRRSLCFDVSSRHITPFLLKEFRFCHAYVCVVVCAGKPIKELNENFPPLLLLLCLYRLYQSEDLAGV
jgi:hypothetical protein